MTDLITRVAVLEEKQKYMTDEFTELKQDVKNIFGAVDEIRLKFSKQNGAIPEMQDDIRQIAEKIGQINNNMIENKVQDTQIEFKVKLMWGGLVFLIGTLATVLINVFIK